MAAVVEPPLKILCHYDPSYKVDTQLHECTLGGSSVHHDVMVEIMTLSAQLDLLCKKELIQHTSRRIDHGNVSDAFNTKAMVLMDRMQSILVSSLYADTPIEDFLDFSGLAKMYPRAAAYVTRPNDLSISLRKTTVDNYFPNFAQLNQIVSMAHQLNSDITNLTNHKYIAHQIALLYQSIVAMGKNPGAVLDGFKQDIEMNFKHVKSAINRCEGIPKLQPEHKQWLLDLTSDLVTTLANFPRELTEDLFPVANILTR